MRQLIDLSHPIEAGMTTYPGMPGPVLSTFTSRTASGDRLVPGVSFHIASIEMIANTGTYLDAPFHYHPDGPDVAELALDRLFDVPAVLVQATGVRAIGPEAFPGAEALAGRAVLVHTGHSRHWRTEAYGQDAPYLTAGAVDLLIDADVRVVAIDTLNIDDVGDPARPAHQGLLGAGIPIAEHLTGLDRLPTDAAITLTLLPAPVRGMGTFPVRVVATVQEP